MTFKEVIDMGFQKVYVVASGCTERSLVSNHFEPFARTRTFVFEIVQVFDDFYYLEHNWLIFGEVPDDCEFTIKDGKAYLYEPELFARPED